jgi:hypothetical protein
MRSNVWISSAAAFLLAGASGCADGGANVGLAFSSRSTGAAAALQAGDSTLVVRGNDTLVIKSVEIVLREIELKRVDQTTDCPDSTGDDDPCEEFSVGLQLVSLPLGNSTDKIVTVNLPAGLYEEVEFEIHKPDQVRDAVFIAAHPAFAGVSIRVTGTFSQAGSRTDFVYTTDLNKEQEIELEPPLDVTDAGAVNLTIRMDIATWFLSGAGSGLVNPATANKNGANEGLVRDNIEASIEAFHDDDSDGLDDDDHEEDDDGGSSHDGPNHN